MNLYHSYLPELGEHIHFWVSDPQFAFHKVKRIARTLQTTKVGKAKPVDCTQPTVTQANQFQLILGEPCYVPKDPQDDALDRLKAMLQEAI